MAKSMVPKIVFFLTIAALSPYILTAESMDFIEHKGLEITQIALDRLGISVELPISRKKIIVYSKRVETTGSSRKESLRKNYRVLRLF